MGFDYDDTIETLKQFNTERENLLERVLANGHTNLAEAVRQSIAKHDENITEIEILRDEQSS